MYILRLKVKQVIVHMAGDKIHCISSFLMLSFL